ncbi:DUF962 domain-containing protein [Bdellovibrio sp. HCB337]|uniref:Mpo1 family 2-hydroxy fatty acid dioxygenase n=1 Tax=Bdellovibrio sp. HCB337 TaxID=3394358 RepID=UPI0039A47E83
MAVDPKKARYWLNLYSESHENPINILLHEIGVPCIAFGILSFLSLLRWPDASIHLNLAIPFIATYTIVYARLGWFYCLAITAEFALIYALVISVGQTQPYPLAIYAGVFFIGWLLQFIGHWIEGKAPAAMKSPKHSAAFTLMAPLFTLDILAKRLGMKGPQ